MSQANFLLTTLECCLSSGLLKFAQPRYVDKKIETGIGVPRFEAVPSNRVTQITGLCDGSHRARLPQSRSLIVANQRPSPERFSMARGQNLVCRFTVLDFPVSLVAVLRKAEVAHQSFFFRRS